MVEATGFEPVTSCMPCKRSPGLSYAPTKGKTVTELFGHPGNVREPFKPEGQKEYSKSSVLSRKQTQRLH